jgi:hypothetical protein
MEKDLLRIKMGIRSDNLIREWLIEFFSITKHRTSIVHESGSWDVDPDLQLLIRYVLKFHKNK